MKGISFAKLFPVPFFSDLHSNPFSCLLYNASSCKLTEYCLRNALSGFFRQSFCIFLCQFSFSMRLMASLELSCQ